MPDMSCVRVGSHVAVKSSFYTFCWLATVTVTTMVDLLSTRGCTRLE